MKSKNILLAGIIALALSGSGFANITGNSTVRLKSTTNQYLNTAQPYYVQYKSGKNHSYKRLFSRHLYDHKPSGLHMNWIDMMRLLLWCLNKSLVT